MGEHRVEVLGTTSTARYLVLQFPPHFGGVAEGGDRATRGVGELLRGIFREVDTRIDGEGRDARSGEDDFIEDTPCYAGATLQRNCIEKRKAVQQVPEPDGIAGFDSFPDLDVPSILDIQIVSINADGSTYRMCRRISCGGLLPRRAP